EVTKAKLAARATTQKQAVVKQVGVDLESLKGQVAETRAKVKADAEPQKNLVSRATAQGFAGVLAKTALKNQAIVASAAAHKTKAAGVVTTQQKAAKQLGIDEGNRGKEGMDKQAQDAMLRGQVKAAGYPNDDRGQAQAEAVLKVAAEVSA